MNVAIVGRGRIGRALARAAREAGHDVVALLRVDADPASPVAAARLGPDVDWRRFDLVLLAFEKRGADAAALAADPHLRELRRIPESTALASVVMAPTPDALDAFLGGRPIAHFLTTPAAALPGAIALLRPGRADATPLKRALPALRWVDAADDAAYQRLGVLMVGSAMAAAALAHLGRALGGSPAPGEAEYLQLVLDDAKRLLALADGDGFRALSAVATPGGFTEKLHDAIFASRRPPGDARR